MIRAALNETEGTETILFKVKQIIAYADDIALTKTSMNVLKEKYGTLRTQSKKIGLVMNEEKKIRA